MNDNDNTPPPPAVTEIDPASTEVIALSSNAEDVQALASIIAFNKPVISNFLDNVSLQDAITFCAWFLGQVEHQKPDLAPLFDVARKVGRDVAVISHHNYRVNTPNYVEDPEALLILFPQMPQPAQPGLFNDGPSRLVQ